MICVSIINRSLGEILEIIGRPGVEMAEIRLDLCPLRDDDYEELFSNADIPLVACCRARTLMTGGLEEKEAWAETERRLSLAVKAGADYADLELEAPSETSKAVRKLCEEEGAELIRSWHTPEGTPDTSYLRQIIRRCFRYGADIAKIVPAANCAEDAARVESLYFPEPGGPGSEPAPENGAAGRLIAFCMGAEGRRSRVNCLKYGAPFTYAAVSGDEVSAPGQTAYSELYPEIFGAAGHYDSELLEMPCSKSFAQRAIIAAALADGVSRLNGYSPCGDSESAISVARALGAEVQVEGNTLIVKGTGPLKGKLPIRTVDVGESGLLARLMIPLLSCLCGGEFTVTGRGTLPDRALSGANDIMAAFGVMVKNLDRRQDREIHIPVTVSGSLIPGVADIPGLHGSQLISGLLMSLPLCDGDSTVYVSEPKSLPYMFITCDVLKKFGIRIGSELEGDAQMIEAQDWSCCSAVNFKIKGGRQLHAASFDLESDWSSAANFMVAGAVFGSARIKGLDTSSLQADLGIVDILVDAGASVSEIEGEEITVRKAPLEAFDADLNNSPDLFPIVCVLAAFCEGRSSISGVRRLSGKESDRSAAVQEMLRKAGVGFSVDGDTMTVEGENLASRCLNGRLLKGGRYDTRHDHRMAMALKVASLGAESPIVIDDEGCVGKSFPRFFEKF